MRKNFLSKGVAVLGAILLLANVTFPGLVAYAQEASEDPVLVYDLIYDEASWNAAYYKENSALKAYYDKYSDEDRWCANASEANGGHWGTCADHGGTWNDSTKKCDGAGSRPAECVQSWSGAISAPGAKYPWAVINVPEEGLTGTIVFEYEGKYEGDFAKAPFGQYITLQNKYGIVSIPSAFNDDTFKIGENSGFDSTKFRIKYRPAEITTLAENTDWFYVHDQSSFESAKTAGKKPLANLYRDYPAYHLWNGVKVGHPTADAECEFESYGDAGATTLYANGTIQGFWPNNHGENAVGITVKTNSVEGYVGNKYYIDLPIGVDDRYKSQVDKVFELFTGDDLQTSANIWAKIKSCNWPGYTNAYTGILNSNLENPDAPLIAIGFDGATQLKIVLKYYDDSDENNIIDKFIRLGNWNDSRDWALAPIKKILELNEINPAKLEVILVGDEAAAVEMEEASYPTYTVSFETNGGSAVESQPVELGKKATKPDTDPTKDGFGFVSWQTCTSDETPVCTDFNFDNPIVENTTLTAKWGSTAWEMYAIHALPITSGGTECNDMGGGNQCKANSTNGTYTTADGTYTITNSDHAITYSGVKIQDPDAQINENGERPSGYVRFGVRFMYPEAVTDNATFKGNKFCDGENPCYFKKSDGYVDSRGQALSSSGLQDLISNGAKTKEWEIKASWNGTEEETFKVILDLGNVEIQNTGGDSVIKVEDYKIVSIGNKTAYTITFDTDGGSAVASISANSGDAITAPANPTKDGYTFNGWDKEIPTVMPAEDLTIKATWKSNSSGGSSSGGGGSSKSSTKATDNKGSVNNATGTNESLTGDNNTEENNNEEDNTPMTLGEAIALFGDEQIDAYQWALENGITTMDTVEKARLDQPLTRAELAKMMVVYMQKVLKADPVVTGEVKYLDVNESLGDLAGYIQLAYQYQIMGINADGTSLENFNPNGVVTRGEYATVFSRVLFGSVFNKEGADFYTNHLEALKEAGILKDTTPTMQEIRGWVMLMMYRSSQNTEKIEEVAAAAEKASVAPAEEASVAPVEGTSVESAEEASATPVEEASAAPAEQAAVAPEASN